MVVAVDHSLSISSDNWAPGLNTEKGIVEALASNGGMRTMSGIYSDLVSQRKDLLYHPLHQLLMAPSREVSPSHGTGKQCVTCKNSSRGKETHSPWGVAWCMDDGYPIIP